LRLKLVYLPKNRQISNGEEFSFNAVIYVVSFHAILRFYCIFIRFYGLLFVVYRGKSTQFFGSARELVCFSLDILVLGTLVIIDDALTFFPKIRITTALLEIT